MPNEQAVSRMVTYVDGIRDATRQRYAREYMKHLLELTDEPGDPPDLTYGEAKTVRLVLNAIVHAEAELQRRN